MSHTHICIATFKNIEIFLFAMTQIYLKDVMLIEISQSQDCMISLVYGI